jgi:predicted AlkP superfamily phosphohydrolase/phosphomutase
VYFVSRPSERSGLFASYSTRRWFRTGSHAREGAYRRCALEAVTSLYRDTSQSGLSRRVRHADVTAPGNRVLVLGLDSIPPELLFDRFLPQMPHVRELLRRSTFGVLRTTDPPITVPAWAVMFSGMDPGTLGVYGFRHRRAGSYWDTYIPTSRTVLQPQVWDRLSRLGRRVCVIGMPPGYPPPAVNGVYVSDFLTPDTANDYVYPPSLREELERVAGRYPFDVTFRKEDRARIGAELLEMTRAHFAVARHLWAKERWDFFALHEIGPDRIHHTFWKYFDEHHPRYEPNPGYRAIVESYYRMLDEEIGNLLKNVADDVRVLLLSDHGSQAMHGCFCVNEWLIQKGLLTLKGPRPPPGTPLEKADIDWSKTSAWGAGGYYARVFFNVRGREPQGILAPSEVARFEERLSREFGTILRPDGTALGTDVRAPRRIYREVRGDAPDLMVYFGDATWRSAGTVGYDSLFLEENDTGPDDSVHSFDGVYVIDRPKSGAGSRGATESLLDIAPTILKMMGVPVPGEMQGRPIDRFL